MGQGSVIYTQGSGFDQLEKYFRLFSGEVPRKIPRDTSRWPDGERYDAPHGFVLLWSDGTWGAVCSESCVTCCKERREPDDEPDISMTCSFGDLPQALRTALPGVRTTVHE